MGTKVNVFLLGLTWFGACSVISLIPHNEFLRLLLFTYYYLHILIQIEITEINQLN